MEKIAIEEIVDNFKNEVEISNFIYVTPNKKDIDGFFFEDSTDNSSHNMDVRERVSDKYYQTFKENCYYVIKLKNTKNVITLNFITTEVLNGFILAYEKIDDWVLLDCILRDSYICYVECRKRYQRKKKVDSLKKK
jgi:hypothetical protein